MLAARNDAIISNSNDQKLKNIEDYYLIKGNGFAEVKFDELLSSEEFKNSLDALISLRNTIKSEVANGSDSGTSGKYSR